MLTIPTLEINPDQRLLSLGAGVQSTALLMLAADGRLPRLDAAIFADTGWEPREVHEHLDRLDREIAQPAGIPILRVQRGQIRRDALDPYARYAQMPLYLLGPDGSHGILRRQCTAEYKIAPIKTEVRRLLGYPHPQRIPAGIFAEQWIGISSDESRRAARISDDVAYMRNKFPLLFLPGGTGRSRRGWTREDCKRYLRTRGFGSTPKSACLGCPFTSNARWREMRDNRPDDWADAVEFDQLIRHGAARANANGMPLRGQAFLHPARVPLDQAPIDRITAPEWRSRQTDIFDQIADIEVELGCSPWACRGDDEADLISTW